MLTRIASSRLFKARKVRAIVQHFDDLVAIPHNFTNPLVMPANGHLYVSLAMPVVAPVLVCTAGDRDMYAGPLAANEMASLGYFEQGVTLTAVYAASTISLYLAAPLGERPLIARKIVP